MEPDTLAETVATDTPAENVLVVSVFEAGLNNSPASEETATAQATATVGAARASQHDLRLLCQRGARLGTASDTALINALLADTCSGFL